MIGVKQFIPQSIGDNTITGQKIQQNINGLANVVNDNVIILNELLKNLTSSSNGLKFHKHNASDIMAGTFGEGDYNIDGDLSITGVLLSGSVPWLRLTNIPSSFTPNSHTHNASQITAGTFGAGDYNVNGSVSVTGQIKSTSGDIRSFQSGANGTYIEIAKYYAALPGFNGYLPTLKTDHTTIYFAANNKYIGNIGNDGTSNIFTIRNLDASENIRLNSDGYSSFIYTGNLGLGIKTPSYKLDVLGDTRLHGDIIWPTVVSGDTDKKIIAKTTNLGDLNVLYIWEDSGEVTQLNMHVGDDGMSYVYIKGAEAEVSGNLTVVGTGYFGELATFSSGITGNGITNNGDIDSTTSGTIATVANLVVTENTTIPSYAGGFYEEGSFTATWDGALGTFTIYYTRVGKQVNLSGSYTGPCFGSETFTTDAIPTSLRPTRIQHFVAQMEASTYTPKSCYIATSGKLYFNVSNIASTPSQTTTACNSMTRNIAFNAHYNLN